MWLQEEPQNMGAWSFIAPRLRALLGADVPLQYVGRTERASPAVGSARVHAAEQAKIVADAFAGVRALQPTT
jgi:2-oxoglutarate dehydrogenase E1 component